MRAGSLAWILGWAVLAACAPSAEPVRIEAPAKLRQALRGLEDLEAGATLVRQDDLRGAELPLARASDGVSFSGFLPADPGAYVLELVFRGRPAGGGPLWFLGRLTSDGFTVEAGVVATPVFSRPLDPIGNSNDHGDDDGDGFGVLDELLFGSDPTAGDTDQDGLPDGQDCDPTMAARRYSILPGGSHEDCDGDRVQRPDLPYGTPGLDCDDRDPTIRPGADDSDCSDGVDRDCNPATCPSDDRDPPVITDLSPAPPQALGCHTRFSAMITDNSTVTLATVNLPPVGGAPRLMVMVGQGGGRYRSPPLSQILYGQTEPSAPVDVTVAALDSASLRAEVAQRYALALSVPTVTSFLPADLGTPTAPFTVSIDAAAEHGVASVTLLAIPRAQAGYYRIEQAMELGRVAGPHLELTIDPAALPTGEILLVPRVEDQVGNRLQPSSIASPSPSQGQLTVASDYTCLDLANLPTVPAKVISVGNDAYRPTTMLERLADAKARAAAVDPAAQFVKVIGYGLRPDGTIDLADATSFDNRWEYGFYNPNSVRWVTITWFTPAFPSQNPVVNPDAGNVVEEVPFLDGDQLLDSDQMAAAYGLIGGCGTLTGDGNDTIIYHRPDLSDADQVYVSAMDLSWVGTAHAPITTVALCQ